MRHGLMLAAVATTLTASCAPKGREAETREALRVEARSPIDRPFTLKGQSALDVDALIGLLPAQARPTYEKSSFDPRLGAQIVTGVAFPDPDGDGPRLPMTVKRLELYGVDREAMRRVNAEKRDNAAPMETVFVKIRAFGVAPERQPGEADSVGAIEWSNLRIRRGAFAPLDNARPTAAHFLNNFELGGIYLKDWAVTGAEGAKDRLDIKTPDLRIVGVGGGKVKAVLAKDSEYRFSMTPEARAAFGAGFGPAIGALLNGPFGFFLFPADQRVTVSRFEWRDLDVSGWMAKELAGETIAMDATGLISLGAMRARKVDTYVRDRLAAKVAEQTVSLQSFVGVVPAAMSSKTKGAIVDLTAYVDGGDKKVVRLLKERRLDRVSASNSFEWTWDAKTGAASLRSDMLAQRFADFVISLDMSGLVAADMEAARKSGARADIFSFSALRKFELRVDDVSMLDTMYAVTATRSGTTPEALRKQMPENFKLLAAGMERLDPRYGQLLGAISAFLTQGGALQITAEPSQPVAFADLGANPQNLARNINLSAKHEAPKTKR